MTDEKKPDDEFFKGRSLARSKVLKHGAPTAFHDLRTPAPAPPVQPSAPSSSPVQAPALRPPESEGRMADVSAKPAVAREAVAEGFLRLRPGTLQAISEGRAPKGDPFGPARIAGILAAKLTPQLIPFCHPIPLAAIEIELQQEADGVRVRAAVKTVAPTGVEMEALAAVTGALLTVWDMTKALEKDDAGQYPDTAIEGVRVLSKKKGRP